MLPPVVEIFVVWHPTDRAGSEVAQQVMEHFHANAFTGLLGGAIEVYPRSEGFRGTADAPRAIPFKEHPEPLELPGACFVAVVPVLGVGLANSVQARQGVWHDYVGSILDAKRADPTRIGIFPVAVDRDAVDGTELGRAFNEFQRIAEAGAADTGEPVDELRCRDLAQAVAQLIGNAHRIKVFISHTTRADLDVAAAVIDLTRTVREVLGQTRLAQFFDAADLQPGEDWETAIRAEASTSSLLALRTDLYSSRAWCQTEMAIAKRHGLPVVIADALTTGEERGSFIMDHVARVPIRRDGSTWDRGSVRRALNLLVDECLKRATWAVQGTLAAASLGDSVSWWAPHAPEPLTLVDWLARAADDGSLAKLSIVRIVHPDPPLGQAELEVLNQVATLSGRGLTLEVLTLRTLAARGGSGRP